VTELSKSAFSDADTAIILQYSILIGGHFLLSYVYLPSVNLTFDSAARWIMVPALDILINYIFKSTCRSDDLS